MEALRAQLTGALEANERLEANNAWLHRQHERLEADNAWLRRQHEQQDARIEQQGVRIEQQDARIEQQDVRHEQQDVRIDTLTVEVRALRQELHATRQELRATATRTNQKLDRLLEVHKESRQALQAQIANLEEQLRRTTRKRTIDPHPDKKVHGIAVVSIPHPEQQDLLIVRCIAGQHHYVLRQIAKYVPNYVRNEPLPTVVDMNASRVLLNFTETANPIDVRNNFVQDGHHAQRLNQEAARNVTFRCVNTSLDLSTPGFTEESILDLVTRLLQRTHTPHQQIELQAQPDIDPYEELSNTLMELVIESEDMSDTESTLDSE
ncbi:hypothetical protein BBO99_00009857 [Phytophthora kernoviae]|uniref:Uncharacterized protein n=1 Tax=Phytophthora kernoviae TaxID=325452 RepID=A0A3R7II74_9STRA|nr:hypothetical protein BBI17_009931 [Phytophthora kernoviae]RLN72273.1 hypothetical protein BBO99_00009857 [Phytophthora kernoviae]